MLPSFAHPKMPEGVSFEIAELIMLRNWAENNALQMVLELDHRDGPQEYEEFIRLSPLGGYAQPIGLWRAPYAVMIAPLDGATRRFVSIAHALAALDVRNGSIALRQDRINGNH